jgi:hypothetical protein
MPPSISWEVQCWELMCQAQWGQGAEAPPHTLQGK